MGEFQSAKVYVFDFHFEADSKEAIARRKEQLDEDFNDILKSLQQVHGDICQVFLRKH